MMNNYWWLFLAVFSGGSLGMVYVIIRSFKNLNKISHIQNPPVLMLLIGVFWLVLVVRFWMNHWGGLPKNAYGYTLAAVTSVVFGEGGLFFLIAGLILWSRK
jgi:hypothetical protein